MTDHAASHPATTRTTRTVVRAALMAVVASAMVACGGGDGVTEQVPETPPPLGPLRVTTVVSGLAHPWSLAFLPDFARDGRMLVTERGGRLLIVERDGSLRPVAGLPAVRAVGQAGLLDVVLDPDHADNRRIYWSYTEAGTGGEAGRDGTAVARGVLDVANASVSDVQVIFRQTPKVAGSDGHYGGRMVFADDQRLMVTLGERLIASQRGYAQDLSRDHGKVVRIERDGSVPLDNPFVSMPGARPAIFSLGHRNPQGAAIHPTTRELWTVEHGPQGGDELNITRAGRNYGWPLMSHGCEYGSPVGSCTPVGGATARAGLEQPLTWWGPVSTAPSGLMFYTGERFPEWRGQAFVGALAGKTLWRLTVDSGEPIVCTPAAGESARHCSHVEAVRDLGVRIRDVRQGPDGWIYLLTDEQRPDGAILRLER